jgi:hypothetical protein
MDVDVERTVGAALQLRVDSELSFDLGRQTGGSREIVSNDAVFDRDVHGVHS